MKNEFKSHLVFLAGMGLYKGYEEVRQIFPGVIFKIFSFSIIFGIYSCFYAFLVMWDYSNFVNIFIAILVLILGAVSLFLPFIAASKSLKRKLSEMKIKTYEEWTDDMMGAFKGILASCFSIMLAFLIIGAKWFSHEKDMRSAYLHAYGEGYFSLLLLFSFEQLFIGWLLLSWIKIIENEQSLVLNSPERGGV
ncbi:hypothetical protein C0584_02620 [Candidatus Parcubacteria bacterium]|nr:MAG: hypothetical protein C0584_02620 [Candidatus Parcubacteria bacterium]